MKIINSNLPSGKELIFNTYKKIQTERVPWIPYTGVHTAQLSKISAEQLLQNEELFYNSLINAYKTYSPDGMPIIFDLQLEAEILGCNLLWDKKSPPSISFHPYSETKKLNKKIPTQTEGRIPIILNVMKRVKKEIGSSTALLGLICGPLTLSSHLRGMELFIDMYEDEEFVHKIIEYSSEVFLTMAEFYIDAGMDIIASVDPIVSQISPQTFEKFLFKPYKQIFKNLKSKIVFSGFFVCGDASKNLDLMCKTNPDSISIDENINIVEAKKITDKYNIVISGNIPLTTTLLFGTQQDNQKYSIDLIDQLGNKNFILAPGCDLPYDTPKENIIGISQAVQNVNATREYLKNYNKKIVKTEIELPNYDNLIKPLIEVFTIDSSTCAACGYMKLAAIEMLKIFEEKIDVVERKITELDNLYRLEKLGIKNLPTLTINGVPKFISIIPNRIELSREIEKYL